MSIRDRLQRWGHSDEAISDNELIVVDNKPLTNKPYQELKSRIHQKMLDRVDLAVMENI
jgi:pilus assembly protein CpaF